MKQVIKYCHSVEKKFICTREKGHTGNHVAYNTWNSILATWINFGPDHTWAEIWGSKEI